MSLKWPRQYSQTSFWSNVTPLLFRNRRVLGVLKDVADQLTLLQKVAQAEARAHVVR